MQRVVAIDGLWWADADRTEAASAPDPESWQAKMAAYYTDAINQHLPLMTATTLDPVVDVFRSAGLLDVEVSPLEEVDRIEREHIPGRKWQAPRYAVTATCPT
ncbi:MAG: hypothetical protein H0V51_02985 [Chloroflexi bacterium]|nr:hypothetical protein [Chloroflexota bacterium]